MALTPQEIAAALAAEQEKAAQAQAIELARLQEEAEALAIEKEKEAKLAEEQAIKDYIDSIEDQLAKPLEEQKGTGPHNALFFTVPGKLVPDKPARVFVNCHMSPVLQGKHNVRIMGGFNEWQIGKVDTSMIPIGNDQTGWFYTDIQVPDIAYGFNFCFEADNAFENNNMDNFYQDVYYGMNKDEVETMMKERAILEEDTEIARKEVETEKYEEGMRKEGATRGTIVKDGRDVVKTERKLVSGEKCTLLFNKAYNPIGGEGKIVAHVGFNKFAMGMEQRLVMELVKGAKVDDNNYWWGVEVDVPPTAYTMDFVISDEEEENWDNNDGNDYRLMVARYKATNADWEARIQKRVVELGKLRVIREEEARIWRAERRKRKQEESRHARMVTVKQQQHIITTEPAIVSAGEKVIVKYNNKNTNLDFAEEVYLTGGFNRWKHPSPPAPMKMVRKTPDAEHLEAVIDVPEDAWMMDFVFSSGLDEYATYDNRFGRDYHIPVENSTTEAPPLHVVHISVEMAPIAKVGGLGDVVVALARAVQDEGNLVEIILPKYAFFDASPMLGGMEWECEFEWGGCKIQVTRCIVEGIQVFFVNPTNGMFGVDSVYGRNDDGMKFDYFCNAALEFLLQTQRQPDILHCHDWSTAEVAPAYWGNYHHNGLWKPKVVFTIHNMNYGQAKIGEASFHSQLTTTVSPSYAGEVSGHPAVNQNLHKFHGVRNGIDAELWDPETDQFLPMNFNADNHEEGKMRARHALQERLNLTWGSDAPIVAVVSRLTAQKGLDLIKHSVGHSLMRGAQYVLLGSAPDPRVQGDFNALAGHFSGPNCALYFAFDEPLSHLVYAAADIILVPSMFEPCGLTQMIAMRYGAIPVVRQTGGLRDTVFDVDYEKERAAWEVDGSTDWKVTGDQTNGFSFEGTDAGGLDFALDRALDAYFNDRGWWRSFQERVMRQDWSWNRPALDYIELYYSAIGH